MNTKEEIEFLEWIRELTVSEHPSGISRYMDDHYSKNINNIIELLQRGEKYEQMWGELNERQGWRFYIQDSIHNIFLHDIMNKLSQKYFPKPVKKCNNIELLEQIKNEYMGNEGSYYVSRFMNICIELFKERRE